MIEYVVPQHLASPLAVSPWLLSSLLEEGSSKGREGEEFPEGPYDSL
jgi:hypothetical protein